MVGPRGGHEEPSAFQPGLPDRRHPGDDDLDFARADPLQHRDRPRDVHPFPEHLVQDFLEERGVLERLQEPRDRDALPVHIAPQRSEFLRDVDERPAQERGVLEDHPEERLQSLRILRAKDVDDLLRFDGPGDLEDDPVRIRLQADALPESSADQGRDQLGQGLVHLRPKTGVHDDHVPRDLDGNSNVGRERRIPDRREVRAEAGGAVFVHGIPREVSLPPDATDFLRDLKRDRNVFSDPRRDVADLADGFDEDVVFLEIDEPPRGPAHDEALPELRILRDEPLVEGSDGPPRGQVDHSVRLHVRNHRDVLEEVRQGVGAPAESAVPGPEEPELAELGDDLVEVHALQVAKRPTPTHRRVRRVERSEPLGHRDGHELVREDGAVVLPDHEVLDLFGQGPPGDRRRLRDIVLVGREDHTVRGLADPVTGAPDPLDEAGDLSR